MAKHDINVSLGFTTDTSEIKSALQDLDKSLKNIQKLPGNASSLFDDREIREASQAALELEQHLNAAVNVNTGNLDLSRFSSSLKASNKSLEEYYQKLISIGPEGQQAFYSLARAISVAETPTARINKALDNTLITLKNTARWQLSSNILHGFMGAVQGAYRYAEDLNASLNDIRIVTGYNAEQMGEFAEKANKAARALSTTTTEYTNASLIYYQQGGMSDAEIAERTEVTIKMANAAGQSAETVSDQLTAVWNNFYDGSKSLEYYADVLTALGAATASSTDEIVEGVQKFAAVADTVGLSYEYAASALATVTATTRESADIVGTAFKTLFARIQGLNLGETLDDGTTLNKYSQALESVGISIFEANGNMKTMDNILDELGDKWGTLSKNQQTALAQTVAGVRQYTQLIALMDNWDFFQKNLQTSYGAEGALNEQAEIYAESWEAARDRVTAAAEDIYASLLDDEFFIKILNGTEKALEALGGFVDGIGGLEGVLSAAGGIFLNIYAKRMPETLNNLKQNLMVFTGLATKSMSDTQQKAVELLKIEAQKANSASMAQKVQNQAMQSSLNMRNFLIQNSKDMSSQEIKEYEMRIRNVEAMWQEAEASAKVLDAKKKEAKNLIQQTKYASSDSGGIFSDYEKIANQMETYKSLKETEKYKNDPAQLAILDKKLNLLEDQLVDIDNRAQALFDTINEGVDINSEDYFKIEDLNEVINKQGKVELEIEDKFKNRITKVMKDTLEEFKQIAESQGAFNAIEIALEGQANAWEELGNSTKDIDKVKQSAKDYGKEIQKLFQNENNKNLLKKVFGDTEDIDKKTTLALEEFYNTLDKGNLTSTEAAQAMRDLSKTLQLDKIVEKSHTEISKLHTKLQNLDLSPEQTKMIEKAFEELAEKGIDVQTLLENISHSASGMPQHFTSLSEVITNFGAAIMNAHALLQSFNHSMEILGDESASSLEKFGASLSLISTAGTTLGSLNKAGSGMLKFIDKAGKLSPKLAEGMKAVANGTSTASQAFMVFGTQLIAASVIVAAVIAAIWGLSKAYEYWKSQQPEERLKAVQEEATKLTSALEEATRASEELSTSIENYDKAIDTINSLARGTEEWKKAIIEANNQARELINNYDLAGKYKFNTDTGLIEFNENALDDLQKKIDNEVQNLTSSSIIAQNTVLKVQAQNEIDGEIFDKIFEEKVKDLEYLNANYLGIDPGAYLIGATSVSKEQTIELRDVIMSLKEAYVNFGGEYALALDSLTETEKEALEQLGYTDVQLSTLIEGLAVNTSAISENNKILGYTSLSDNPNYQKLSDEDKEFVASVYGSSLNAKTTQIYKNEFQNMSNKEASELYAKIKGLNYISTEGNLSTFIDISGNKQEVDTSVLKYLLAQREVELSYSEDEEVAKILNIKNQTDEYFDEIFKRKAEDGTLGKYLSSMSINPTDLGRIDDRIGSSRWTDEEWQNYIKSNETLQKAQWLQTILNNLNNFSDISEEDAEKFINNYENIDLETIAKSSNLAKTLDEFYLQLENSFISKETQKYQDLANNIKTILTESLDTEELNNIALQNNQEFLKLLEEENLNYNSFLASNYEERYSYLVKFYKKAQSKARDNAEKELESQKNLLKLYQQAQDYRKDRHQQKYYSEEVISLAAEYDETELQRIIDEINIKINQIDTSLKITFDWAEVDIFANAQTKLSEFTKTLQDDIKKVGNDYQFTAEQAREWMEIYPSLFKNAINASDGLIKINEKYVKEFISGQESTTDAAIQAKISQLELDKTTTENKIKQLEKNKKVLELYLTNEQSLENANADVLEGISDALLQVYIKNGVERGVAEKIILDQLKKLNAKYLSDTELMTSSKERAETKMSTMSYGEKRSIAKAQLVKYNVEQLEGEEKTYWENAYKLGAKNKYSGSFYISPNETYSIDAENAKYIDQIIDDYLKNTPEALDELVKSYYIDFYNKKYSENQEFNVEDLFEQIKSGVEEIDKLFGENLKEGTDETFKLAIAEIDSQLAEEYTKLADITNSITYLKSLKDQDLIKLGLSKEELEEIDIELREIVERYHEILRVIKYYENELDKIQEKKDKAHGKDKLNILNEEAKVLQKIVEEQKNLNTAQSIMLKADKIKVNDYSDEKDNKFKEIKDQYNIDDLQFSEVTGEFTNYTTVLRQLEDIEENLIKEVEKAETEEERKKAQENLDDFKAFSDEQLKRITQYENTLDDFRESEQNINDSLTKIQDNAYEKLTLELDLDLKIRDIEMKEIEYSLSQIEDDIYSSVEAFGLLDDKFQHANDTLWDYNASYQHLLETQDQYTNAQFIEYMERVRDGIYEQLGALTEYEKEMKEFYGETLQEAQKEIERYTSSMSALTQVLEHYQNIVELINGEYDFDAIGTIIQGRIDTTYNELIQSQRNLELMEAEYNAAMNNIANASSPKEKEALKKAYEPIISAYESTWETVLSKTEEYVQLLKEKLEKKMSEAARAMEMAMTDGFGFDFLNESMDRAESYADEFLTKTNQLYETQKLMRSIQTASDKTDNAASKKRFKNMLDETQQLQDKNQLSQFELEIQQAKFDLLLAEIALEEAQNAKSTVRLQRTSEGTFGYVYTADQEQVADAEQKVADEYNNLYNILEDGEKEYDKKIFEARQGLAEALIDLEEKRINGEISSEEKYQEMKLQIQQEFGKQIEFYEEMRNLAFQEDYNWRQDLASKVTESIYESESDLIQKMTTQTNLYTETWTTNYDKVLEKNKNWSETSQEYIDACEQAFEDWRIKAADENLKIQIVFKNTEGAVKAVVDESNKLATVLDEEVREKAAAALTQANNLTLAYSAQVLEIDKLKTAYHDLILEMNKYLELAYQTVPPEDYSLAMGNYIRNGGNVGDINWNKYETERIAKMTEAQYIQYQATSGLFNELMSQYDAYRDWGWKNELTDYVDNILDTNGIWDFATIERLIQTNYSNSSQINTNGYTGNQTTADKILSNSSSNSTFGNGIVSVFGEILSAIPEMSKTINDMAKQNALYGTITSVPFSNQASFGEIQQSVQIDANFPSITSGGEVEEALLNLIGTSIQYVHRNIPSII